MYEYLVGTGGYDLYAELWRSCAGTLVDLPRQDRGFSTFLKVTWNRHVYTCAGKQISFSHVIISS